MLRNLNVRDSNEGEQFAVISTKLDVTAVLKAKDLQTCLKRMPKKNVENKFMFAALTHSITESQKTRGGQEDKNVAEKVFNRVTDRLTMGASNLLSFGKNSLNFILPEATIISNSR